MEKKDIRKLDLEELQSVFAEKGEKAFRAKQVYEWLWAKSARDFNSMTNLSKELREWLEENFLLLPVQIKNLQTSNDGTIKTAFELHDKNVVEGVLIPTETRMTACISSQVGCSLACKFCATGYLGHTRNLEAGEIYDQVVAIRNQAEVNHGKPLTNIVYMGMGEPLLNYKNVLKSVEHITSDKGLGMAARRITISTAGIAKMIKKLALDNTGFNLALSLHAANDAKRNKIMPINETNSLPALEEALNYYCKNTGQQVTFEYIVFKDFNDQLQDAAELQKLVSRIPSKVNIIEYNPIDKGGFLNTSADRLEKFKEFLESKRVNVRLRISRGKDIDAACGQLANKEGQSS